MSYFENTMTLDIATAISVGSAVVVLLFTAVVAPLIKSVMRSKDVQFDRMAIELDEVRKHNECLQTSLQTRITTHDADDVRRREELMRQIHVLELKVQRLETEAETRDVKAEFMRVHARLDDVFKELSDMHEEIGRLKGTTGRAGTGYRSSSQSQELQATSDPPHPRPR